MVFLVVHRKHLKQVSNSEPYEIWDTEYRIEPLHKGSGMVSDLEL